MVLSFSSTGNDNYIETLTMTKPDDCTYTFEMVRKSLRGATHRAETFDRALIMPNLQPPMRTAEEADTYRKLILDAAKTTNAKFEPHMTFVFNGRDEREDGGRRRESGFVRGLLYPAGATTNSSFGVTDVKKVMPALRRMAELGLILQVRMEVTHQSVDIFDHEARYIEEVLKPLLEEVKDLRVVMEHITTKNAADFLSNFPESGRLAATITPQHVLLNRNAL